MSKHMKSIRRGAGFSLIEILIAVVILATGLLALTALQGRLAQASAEAKVRSRVASLLTSRMDELRAAQYESIPPAAGSASDTGTATCGGGAAWVCTAQSESSVSGLSVGHVYQHFLDVAGAFTISPAVAPTPATAEFKRLTLTATWKDAAGVDHSLAMSTDVSPLSLTARRIPNAPGGVGSAESAVVRQDNPAGPGVIPIAIGGGDATAASNPRPEIIGKNNNSSVVGTRFDVLTYNGISGASVIQRRVETAAIACTCQYGAGGTNLGEIYRTAQWPAEWTGERYEVIAPAGNPAAPGQMLSSGPLAGAVQNPLCTECCRDHHDSAANSSNQFDPVRTGSFEHYDAKLTTVGPANGNNYIEACRLVRVDGFWRTATDMYAKHFGLINTTSVSGVAAKSGAPDAAAVTLYQDYVKTYLGAYTASPATILDANDGGQIPITSVISINKPPPADERYLHARGLYVDYLNQKARDRLTKALLPANCPGVDKTECILPYLPFTTINTTELAYWQAQVAGAADTNILTVATGSSLVFDPLQPTRGRTNAKSTTTNGQEADATAIITRSNAGVAVAQPVDPQDKAAEGADRQRFKVVASGIPTTGQNFSVRLAGLPQTSDSSTSNDPALIWTNATGSANCNATLSSNNDRDPNDYACNTFGALGIVTTVGFSNYFREYDVLETMTATCGGTSATDKVARPTFSNFALSSATVGGVSASTLAVSNDGKTSESTIASFASIPSGGLVTATFTLTSTLQATITSCTTNNAGNQINNIVWNRPWLP